MKNLKSTALQATSVAFGITHFVLQSAADLTVHAEASLLSRHTTLKYHEIKELRRAETKRDQTQLRSIIANNKAKLMAMKA